MNILSEITWLGHASFFFTDRQSQNRIYYIDPFEIQNKSLAKADLVFVTHAHHDHFSPRDLDHVLGDETTVIATADVLAKIELPENHKVAVVPNQSYAINKFSFETVPAYNVHPNKLSFHPKSNNWVGYILPINEQRIYHAGDTDFIPEMKTFKDKHIDIALLPIGGTYTMGVQEAIEAANAIQAKFTVPMHYRKLLGEKYKDAEEQFKNGVIHSSVVILEELK